MFILSLLHYVQSVSYNRHMSEPGESKETGPGISPVRKNRLDVNALRNSIARAQERGKLPTIPEKPSEKVLTPPFVQKSVPPFIEEVPQNSSNQTHEQAMDFFHKAQKEYQANLPEKPKTQAHLTPVASPAMDTFHNIEKEYQERQLELKNAKNQNTQKEYQPHGPLVEKQTTLDTRSVIKSPYEQSLPPNSPQIEERKSAFRRFFDRLSGKL